MLAYLRPQNTLSSAHFCHNNFKPVLCTEESASLATSNSIKSKNNGYWPDIFVCNNRKDFFLKNEKQKMNILQIELVFRPVESQFFYRR